MTNKLCNKSLQQISLRYAPKKQGHSEDRQVNSSAKYTKNKHMKIIILMMFFIITKNYAGFFSDFVENPKEFFSDVAEKLDEGVKDSFISLHNTGLISYEFTQTTNKPINRVFGIKLGSVFEKAKPSKVEWLGKEVGTKFQPTNTIPFLSKFEVFVDEERKVYKILSQSNPTEGKKNCKAQIKKFVDIVEQKYEVTFYNDGVFFMGQDSMVLISNVYNSGVITTKCYTNNRAKNRKQVSLNQNSHIKYWNLHIEYNNKSIESNFNDYLWKLRLREQKNSNDTIDKDRKDKHNKYDI